MSESYAVCAIRLVPDDLVVVLRLGSRLPVLPVDVVKLRPFAVVETKACQPLAGAQIRGAETAVAGALVGGDRTSACQCAHGIAVEVVAQGKVVDGKCCVHVVSPKIGSVYRFEMCLRLWLLVRHDQDTAGTVPNSAILIANRIQYIDFIEYKIYT